jgi:hypothetical protein
MTQFQMDEHAFDAAVECLEGQLRASPYPPDGEVIGSVVRVMEAGSQLSLDSERRTLALRVAMDHWRLARQAGGRNEICSALTALLLTLFGAPFPLLRTTWAPDSEDDIIAGLSAVLGDACGDLRAAAAPDPTPAAAAVSAMEDTPPKPSASPLPPSTWVRCRDNKPSGSSKWAHCSAILLMLVAESQILPTTITPFPPCFRHL